MAQFIALDTNDTELQQTIASLTDKLGDLNPVMAEIGASLLLSTRDRFDNQTAPDGTKWTPLTEAYAKRKAKSSTALKGILTLTGAMRDTITYEAFSDSVLVGSNRVYAAIHQLGGTAGKNADIPSRPFLGLDETDRAEILGILTDHLSD